MSSVPCIQCGRDITRRHHAIQCDSCEKWQHRLCDTGISYRQYRDMVEEKTRIEWKCDGCKQNEEQMDVTINYSDINASSSRYSLELPLRTPIESTRLSAAASITLEGSPSRRSKETNMDVDDMETSSFDVTRPDRSMPNEQLENSLADETVHDVPEDAPVTYQVIDGGSEKGGRKLVSSAGYAFVYKRTLAKGTIDWRCSVRGKGSGCPATIKQLGDEFRVAGSAHNHPSKPGITTAIQIKKEVKAIAKSQVFESAQVLVRQVTDDHLKHEQPEGARPSHEGLLKMCNRARKQLRPQDPKNLDCEYLLKNKV